MPTPTTADFLRAQQHGPLTDGVAPAIPKAHDYHVPRPCPKHGDVWARYLKTGTANAYRRVEFMITEVFDDPAPGAFTQRVTDDGAPMGVVTILAPLNERGDKDPVVCSRAGDRVVVSLSDRMPFPADWVFMPATSKIHNRGYFHPPDMEWSEEELRFVKKEAKVQPQVQPQAVKKGA